MRTVTELIFLCKTVKLSKTVCVTIINTKISYCRGTGRRTVLVNLCYISRAVGVIKVSNSKSDLQGHWQQCHSIGHIRFPISLPLQPCLYLAPFPRYVITSQNLWRSHDSEHIPFGSNISRMHTYFSVSIIARNLKCFSFLASPIIKMIGAKFKKRVT